VKFIWECADITPGRTYSRVGLGEDWLIGYRDDTSDDKLRYVSISLTDGLVTLPLDKETLAERLTNQGYVPCEFLAAATKGAQS